MYHRPSKKRSVEESAAGASAIVEAENEAVTLVPQRTTTETFGTSKLPPFVLEQQIESLKAELEYERSGRALDLKRAQNAKERVEKQLEIAVEEAQEATKALDDFRASSDKMTNQLREARNQAVEELRNFQIRQLEGSTPEASEEGESEDSADEEGGESMTPHKRKISRHSRTSLEVASMSNVWKEKCHHLEHLLETQKGIEKELNQKLVGLQKDFETFQEEQKEALAKMPKPPPAKIMEDAPPQLMKELNRLRISSSESERRERQLKRKVDELNKRMQNLVQEREEARMAKSRLPVVQEELQNLRQTHEALVVQHQAWKDFGQSLETVLFDNNNNTATKARSGPPELSSIQRFLETAKARVTDLEKKNAGLMEQNKGLKAQSVPLEKQIKELTDNEQTIQREKRQVEHQLSLSNRHAVQLESQQAIYKREISNLQSLIKTLDDLPLASTSKSGGTAANETAIQTLEISLGAAKQQLEVVTEEKKRLSKESEDTQKELERVKEKFGKLKEALMAERSKAEQAEQRANEAEALAGKGSFNPETTRVLHLQETPLAEALKEEIVVLKKQLEVANNNKSTGKAQQPHADPNKLNQRLKENFKEQIALFREGVYLMTGFKVDMLPGSSENRPTFRVRSMYAEQEEDHLMLKWPKGEDVSSLDILNTELAKSLSKTPCYENMTKFHSLPAFLASAQLYLFEKQTIMM